MPTPELQPRTIAGVFLGSLCGGLASLFSPDSVIYSAFCTTLGGTLFALIESKVGRSVGRWLLFLSTTALFFGTSYLCIIDPLRKGDHLLTTNSVKFHSELSDRESDCQSLPAHTKVTYLERSFRRYRISREHASYLDFWRYVELEDQRRGWIYGAYLTKHSSP